jgi:pilus assembly protein Flp/PilA
MATKGMNPRAWRIGMKRLSRWMVEFLKKEDGPTAVEYAVMLALIVVVCIASITSLGTTTNSTFSFISVKLQSS